MKSVPKPRGSRRVQYAALPYRQRQDGEIQIRLITSRETRRWVIPKGWPMKGLSPSKAAAREAYEEAGLLGSISSEPLGLYSYDKRLTLQTVPCDVMVFPLKVKRYVKKWPERSERFGFWFSVESAAAAVQEEDLRLIILAFGEQMAARFAEKRSRSPEAGMAPTADVSVTAAAKAKPAAKEKPAVAAKAKAPAKAAAKPKAEAKSKAAAKAEAKPKSEAKPKAATEVDAKPRADAKPKPKAAAKPQKQAQEVAVVAAPAKSSKAKAGKAKPQDKAKSPPKAKSQPKAKGQRVVLAEAPEADWAEDEASARLPVLPGMNVPSTRH